MSELTLTERQEYEERLDAVKLRLETAERQNSGLRHDVRFLGILAWLLIVALAGSLTANFARYLV